MKLPTYTLREPSGRIRLFLRLVLGTLTVVCGLFVTMVAQQLANYWIAEPPPLLGNIIGATVMMGVVIPLVICLRRNVDNRPLAGIGFSEPKRAIRLFALGFSIPSAILLLPLLIILVSGIATIRINVTPTFLGMATAWLILALMYEAIPEEIAIRGYLYRNLSERFVRWLAALISIGFFVCIPLSLELIHRITGISGNFGGSQFLTSEYLVLLITFGALLAYLRVVTNSVWTCVGFHVAFLQLGRHVWVGVEDNVVFQVQTTNSQAVDLIYWGTALAGLLFVFLLPYFMREKPGWRQRDCE